MRHRTVKSKGITIEAGKEYIVQGDPRDNKGRWQLLFGNTNPIRLEIGSGKGQFLCTMAKLNPDVNFLACEGISDVYVRIVEKCIAGDIKNLLLMPCFMDRASEFFEDGELDEIYINFCDPWPKKKHIKRRLTNKAMLSEYAKVLGEGKLIQFKTDNDALFDFTLDEIRAVGFEIEGMSRNLLGSEYESENVHTEYEDKFESTGKSINYLLARTLKKPALRYILASASPRRRDLMKRIADNFETVVADIDERKIEDEIMRELSEKDKYGSIPIDMCEAAKKICTRLAYEKAKAVQNKIKAEGNCTEDYIIIGCDTSVALPDEILGKPVDRDDAVRMLRKESEYPQTVVSGVTFISPDCEYSFCEASSVIFHKLDEAQELRIQKYCDTNEPYDKAGAYGIQLYGDELVEKTQGDFYNIVGFPVDRIKKELQFFMQKIYN